MSFNEYVKKHIADDSPEGDFARDWASSKKKPRIKTKGDLMGYLYCQSACGEAIAIAESMFLKYKIGQDKTKELKNLCCSFCGKSQNEVEKMITGANACICEECVELCADIVERN